MSTRPPRSLRLLVRPAPTTLTQVPTLLLLARMLPRVTSSQSPPLQTKPHALQGAINRWLGKSPASTPTPATMSTQPASPAKSPAPSAPTSHPPARPPASTPTPATTSPPPASRPRPPAPRAHSSHPPASPPASTQIPATTSPPQARRPRLHAPRAPPIRCQALQTRTPASPRIQATTQRMVQPHRQHAYLGPTNPQLGRPIVFHPVQGISCPHMLPLASPLAT